MTDWTSLIDDILKGRWVNPLTGKIAPPQPSGQIVIEEDLSGREADLVSSLGFEPPFAVVSDENTHPAMGARVARALAARGTVRNVILDAPHCDMNGIRQLEERLRNCASVIAVGSGTINDMCKYVTFHGGRDYAVFGTAASMNGYTSSTASVTQDNGLKVTVPTHMPKGAFIDLKVCAAAPPYLAAAGLGDCLCRSVAQVDWWMSHRLLETGFSFTPYVIEIPDEVIMLDRAGGLPAGDIEAIGALVRVLILCGIGVGFTGVSNHGSMGEHQISHYLDCFAGPLHPGTIHGQQVGVASLTMARIQGHFLQSETPPVLGQTRIDEAGMTARMGPEIARDCVAEYRKKALDTEGADRLNARLAKIWPDLRDECLAIYKPAAELAERLATAGGATTATELGFPVEVYREAVMHAHEMRNRYSFADIADGTGDLRDLAGRET